MVATMREKLNERLGREASSVHVYRALKRHGWRKSYAAAKHPKAAGQEEQDFSKIKGLYQEAVDQKSGKTVRVMFQHEAGF